MKKKSLEIVNALKKRNRISQSEKFVFLVLSCLTLFMTPARLFADSTYSVVIATSSLSGTSADLAFDLLNGGSASNTVTISGLSTDGTLGAVSTTGEVTGTLPGTVTLMDSPSSFFNEYLTGITLGSRFSFVLDVTTNGPNLSSLPDAFSLLLLNPVTGLPLFATTDPTGSNSLLTLNIDGSPQGALSAYIAPGGEAVVTATPVSTTTVPEPGTIFLLVSGFALVLSKRKSLGRQPT